MRRESSGRGRPCSLTGAGRCRPGAGPDPPFWSSTGQRISATGAHTPPQEKSRRAPTDRPPPPSSRTSFSSSRRRWTSTSGGAGPLAGIDPGPTRSQPRRVSGLIPSLFADPPKTPPGPIRIGQSAPSTSRIARRLSPSGHFPGAGTTPHHSLESRNPLHGIIQVRCLARVFFGARPAVVLVCLGRYKCLTCQAFWRDEPMRAAVPQQDGPGRPRPSPAAPVPANDPACAVRHEKPFAGQAGGGSPGSWSCGTVLSRENRVAKVQQLAESVVGNDQAARPGNHFRPRMASSSSSVCPDSGSASCALIAGATSSRNHCSTPSPDKRSLRSLRASRASA